MDEHTDRFDYTLFSFSDGRTLTLRKIKRWGRKHPILKYPVYLLTVMCILVVHSFGCLRQFFVSRKPGLRRKTALVMSAVLVFVSTDLSAWAAEENELLRPHIIAFEALPAGIDVQCLEEGAPESDIRFPSELRVTTRRLVPAEDLEETETETEAETETESETEFETESESGIETETETASEAESVFETESESVAESETIETVVETEAVETLADTEETETLADTEETGSVEETVTETAADESETVTETEAGEEIPDRSGSEDAEQNAEPEAGDTEASALIPWFMELLFPAVNVYASELPEVSESEESLEESTEEAEVNEARGASENVEESEAETQPEDSGEPESLESVTAETETAESEPAEDGAETVAEESFAAEESVASENAETETAEAEAGSERDVETESETETESESETETEEIEYIEVTETLSIPVTWKLNPGRSSRESFSSENVGDVFVYEPVLPGEYIVEAEAPTILVQIGTLEFAEFHESILMDGVVITVDAEPGVFPVGCSLSVLKILNPAASGIEDAVDAKRDHSEKLAFSSTYDIRILDKNGNEVEPDTERGKVWVSFAMDQVENENLEAQVYHMPKEDGRAAEATVLEYECSGNLLTAETDGFSFYTVEFTYGSKEYVLYGNNAVPLSEILDTVGITGEVTLASGSDDTLFFVAKVQESEPGVAARDTSDQLIPDPSGVWYVAALVPFTTTETLSVEIGGITYEVYVTAVATGMPGAHSFTNGNGDVFLGGNYIEVGIAKSGSFGSDGVTTGSSIAFHPTAGFGGRIGLSVDPDGFDVGNDPITGDYFLPGTPEERYILSYTIDGVKVDNCNAQQISYGEHAWYSPQQAPVTVDKSDLRAGRLKAVTTGITKDGVKMILTISFGVNDQYFQTDVQIINLSGKPLTDVRFVRSFDPDQDQELYGDYKTYNKVICNPCSTVEYTSDQCALVVAKGAYTQAGFFFTAFDEHARASVGADFMPQSAYLTGLWVDNPSLPQIPTSEMLDGVDGYVLKDTGVAMCFKFDNLAAGNSVAFNYKSSLAPDVQSTFDSIRPQPVVAVKKTFTYNGEDQTFDPTTDLEVTNHGHTLVYGTDYDLTTGTQLTGHDAGPYTLNLVFTDPEIAPKEAKWYIQPKQLTAAMLSLSNGISPDYTGAVIDQVLTVTDHQRGVDLLEGTDYDKAGTLSASAKGIYTVSVTGMGNYAGTVPITWEIAPDTWLNDIPVVDLDLEVDLMLGLASAGSVTKEVDLSEYLDPNAVYNGLQVNTEEPGGKHLESLVRVGTLNTTTHKLPMTFRVMPRVTGGYELPFGQVELNFTSPNYRPYKIRVNIRSHATDHQYDTNSVITPFEGLEQTGLKEYTEDQNDMSVRVTLKGKALAETAVEDETKEGIRYRMENAFSGIDEQYMNLDYLDMKVVKEVEEGVPSATENTIVLSEAPDLGHVIEIALTYDGVDKYSPVVFREHEGVVIQMTELAGRAAPGSYVDGTYAVVGNIIYVYSRYFSTYAVGYTSIQTYKVTFDDGSGNTIGQTVVVAGGLLLRPLNPTRPGYTFTNWYLGYNEWNFSNAVNCDITLVAGWNMIPDAPDDDDDEPILPDPVPIEATQETTTQTEPEPEPDPDPVLARLRSPATGDATGLMKYWIMTLAFGGKLVETLMKKIRDRRR